MCTSVARAAYAEKPTLCPDFTIQSQSAPNYPSDLNFTSFTQAECCETCQNITGCTMWQLVSAALVPLFVCLSVLVSCLYLSLVLCL